jgi:hypothetical protein
VSEPVGGHMSPRGLAVRCTGDGCGMMLQVPFPIDADEFVVRVLRGGWACVGNLSHVGYVFVYCWPCAEEVLTPELREEHRKAMEKIAKAFPETRESKESVS